MRTPAIVDLLRADAGGTDVAAWSIYVNDTRRLALGIKDRQAGNSHAPLSLTETRGARYRIVWSDGRISRGSLERRQLRADPHETLAEVRAAAYDDPDAAVVSGPSEMPRVEIHDPRAAALAGGDTGPWAERLNRIRDVVNERELRTWSGMLSASAARAHLVTSAGLDVRGEGTTASWYVSLNGESGGGFRGRAPDSEPEFHARLDRIAEIARHLATPGPSRAGGVLPVVLHPQVVESYVLSGLLHHLAGATVAHGEGRFPRDSFGTDRTFLREDLTLRLDPLQPLQSGSYSFTPEGVPAARCTYIERGRLIHPVLDLKYARRLGLDPTPVPFAMDALRLEGPAPLALPEALAGAEGGALVLSVLGVHTQDRSSGDFSLSAPQALAIDAGGLDGRLRATLSGNLFDLLRQPELQLVTFPGEHTPGLSVLCRLDPK